MNLKITDIAQYCSLDASRIIRAVRDKEWQYQNVIFCEGKANYIPATYVEELGNFLSVKYPNANTAFNVERWNELVKNPNVLNVERHSIQTRTTVETISTETVEHIATVEHGSTPIEHRSTPEKQPKYIRFIKSIHMSVIMVFILAVGGFSMNIIDAQERNLNMVTACTISLCLAVFMCWAAFKTQNAAIAWFSILQLGLSAANLGILKTELYTQGLDIIVAKYCYTIAFPLMEMVFVRQIQLENETYN